MTLDEVGTLFDYDRWANERLREAVAKLPPDAIDRELGSQFSFPTLKGMMAHIMGGQIVWVARWKGEPPSVPTAKDFPDLAALCERWARAEADLAVFAEGLVEADLARTIQYKNPQGQAFALPLAHLIRHLVNHGTHHRSEVSTMLTVLGVSPPPTDLTVYHLTRTGQIS